MSSTLLNPSPLSRFHATLRAALAAGLLATLAACATGAGSQWPTLSDVATQQTAFSPAGLGALEARMKEAVEKKEVAGVITLLAHKGEVASFKVEGVRDLASGAPLTEDTLFRIYSMTKPITGVALMQLYEEGKWGLDDPITKFIPEFANLKVHGGTDAAGKAIMVDMTRPPTMRELMTHTAGFGYGLSQGNPVDDAFRAAQPLGKPDMQSLIDTVAGLPLIAQPGERWYYSIAVDLQGAIVERLSGMPFDAYLERHIFRPAGMTDTSFVVAEADRARLATVYTWDRQSGGLNFFPDDPTRDFFKADHIPSGGGGLVSTMRDYARFCQMLLNGGEINGRRLLKPESIALMTQNHIGDLRLYSDGTSANSGLPGTGFGLDFAVVTDPAALDSKQGVGSYYWSGIAGTWFWIDPTNDLFFIGMIQRRGGAGPGSVNFRNDSTRLVYEALNPPAG
ncbi:serine hydrolase [bacterium]|nr:serine hydrolase [bacterium]